MSKTRAVYSKGRAAASRFGLVALLAALAGCGSQTEPRSGAPAATTPDLELARVGDTVIRLKDYNDFYADVPAALQSNRTGVEKARNHLQTLIDVELLQLEAKARGIENSPAFTRKMSRLQQERLVGLYQVRKLRPEVSQEQLQSYFDREGLSRAVRFSDIVVPSLDSARAVVRELAKGKRFADVASKWSMHGATAKRGGDSWVFVNKLEITPELREPLFKLKVGEVSGPIDVGGAWGVFEASEEKVKALDAHTSQMIYKDLYLQDHIRRRGLLADSLAAAYHLEMVEAGVKSFLARMRAGATADEEALAGITLYRYDGGTITGAELVAAAAQFAAEGYDPKNRQAVLSLAAKTVVPDELFMKAAQQEGVDRDVDLTEWLARKKADLLVTQLRVEVLAAQVSISEEELQAYYAQHPEKFRKLEQTQIQEVLVATAAEAAEVVRRVNQGESLGELAKQLSIRPPDQRDAEGRLTLYLTYSRALHLDLIKAAAEVEPGELVGPVETHGGFSVFRVLSRRGEQETFTEARQRVQATVNWIKKQQVFEAFLAELRQKYAAQVQVREDHLQQVFAGG